MGHVQHQIRERAIELDVEPGVLQGDCRTVEEPRGVIIFAHGSGSSRKSSRNRRVAAHLNEAGFSTLLFDLLTEEEEVQDLRTAALRFDIGTLSDRLVNAVDWARQHQDLEGRPIGLFGASTGAAAALNAAAERPEAVMAVVSRGGRPDLAAENLHRVQASTLLLVGSLDAAVLRINRAAYDKLVADRTLVVVEGATHLFEEPGKLDEVARQAAAYFSEKMQRPHA